MTKTDGIYSGDAIEQALIAPIDWGKLESIAYEVLIADDFPSLRKIGGVGDDGMDAIEETFYEATRRVTTVVQVTSAQAQKAKVRDTIKKLAKNGIQTRMLVFLTRHPVSAHTRSEMVQEADSEGVTLDVRDQSYLVAQLSRNNNIFARHFSDARAQLAALLSAPDPLHAASDRLHHALLATLGAYVLSDHSRMARGMLFEKTVLAAMAASTGGKTNKEDLLNSVRKLLPAENVTRQQLDSAIERLARSGDCSINGDDIACSDEVLIKCLAAARRADDGFKKLYDHLLNECGKWVQLTDALRGYLERNLRRSVVQLLRTTGPLKSDDEQRLQFDPHAADEVREVLCQDLPPDMARTALVAFSSFVADAARGPLLAPLVNSYAALAMRNLDPVGRRWQQTVLSRSVISIDTDVLLYLIVEELPEHSAILAALKNLQSENVEIVVPEHVFAEAVGHLERAPRTYRRFADRLLRFPPEFIDARVWHAVVRGFYYAKRNGYSGSFEQYYSKYHLPGNSVEFTEHLLSKRLPLKQRSMDEVPMRDTEALHEIGASVLEFRERSRRKASFRDPIEMAQRVRSDVAMALTLAAKAEEQIGAPAKGYVASSDRAFRMIETHDKWKPRKPVHIWSNALPQLSSFACGSTLAPNDAVEFLFSPVIVAAAELMAPQINVLTSIGVELKEIPLDRLDWDLRQSLNDKLDALSTAVTEATTDIDNASAIATLRLAQAATKAGYEVVPQITTLIQEFDLTKEQLDSERLKRQNVEQQLRTLVALVREQSTSKARRRFNNLVDEVGLSLNDQQESSEENYD